VNPNTGMSFDGRCQDALLNNTAPPSNDFVCNTFLTQILCTSHESCIWRLNNDSCSCTFTGCKCSDPSAGTKKSASFDFITTILVVIPIIAVTILVSCEFGPVDLLHIWLCTETSPYHFQKMILAGIGYVYRRSAARFFVKICPGSVIEALAVKDNLDATSGQKKVKPPDDEDIAITEPGPQQRRKAKHEEHAYE
jgi:hypothetical protein